MTKTKHILNLLLFCCLLFCSKLINAQCHIDDWTALKALYEATDGDNWKNNTGWEIVKSDEPSLGCDLENLLGVSLDENGRVDSLYLSLNRLNGYIPPSLGKLSNLVSLNLEGNWLHSNIPMRLSLNLKKLKEINLSSNNLSENIPVHLSNLSNLSILNLYKNNYSGNIPPELSTLKKLTYLNLGRNPLEGVIPPELGELNNLMEMHLSRNILKGNIPPELGNLSNLTRLDLSNNQLSGSIPAELSNASKLKFLSLTSNQLSGNIPPEMGRSVNIETLSLDQNQLNGSIPSEIGNLVKLKQLRLEENKLNGSIPPELGNLINLERLYLYNNQLNGNIPLEFAKLTNLQNLSLQNNQLSGSIPYELFIIDDFYFNIESNFFTCNDIIKFISDTDQHIDYYNIEHSTPQNYFHNAEKLFTVDNSFESITLSAPLNEPGNLTYQWYKNQMSVAGATDTILVLNNIELEDLGGYTLHVNGSDCGIEFISEPIMVRRTNFGPCHIDDWTALKALYESTDGYNWKNNTGWEIVKNDEIPFDCNLENLFGVKLDENGRVDYLDLWYNKLTGNIPLQLGSLTKLTELNLRGNQLSGKIPSEIGTLVNLIELNLAYNQLNGEIPAEFGNLRNLKELYLSNNNLGGSIPKELGNLLNLKWLYLYSNKLSGSIPKELGNLHKLIDLWLYSNNLSGEIPPELGNLLELSQLSLGANQLSGNIPPELGNLSKLFELGLSSNQLSGSIPNEISNINSLKLVYLGNNKLSGNLPKLNNEIHHVDISFNYYTCNDIENFEYTYDPDAKFMYSFLSPVYSGPQYYSHDAQKYFLLDDSLASISLSAPFYQEGNFSYRWYKNGSPLYDPISYEDSVLHLTNIKTEDIGDYQLAVSISCIMDINESYNTYYPSQFISDPISVRRTDLEGCTDINSCNYNEFAMIDDGSCEYIWCDTMTNPIRIRTTNEVILSDTTIQFDLVIDSLGLDYSADNLTFTLDTRGNYRIKSVEAVNPILSMSEVDISKLYKNTLSIDRSNNQYLASNKPLLRATGMIILEDVPVDESTCSHFVISGGTEIASGHFIDFENMYIDIPFSDCSPYGGYGAEGSNWLPVVLTVSPQNCNTGVESSAEIKILEEGQSPFTYTLKDEQGTVVLEATSEENTIEIPGLNAGNYELTIFDMLGRKTTVKTCIPLVANINGNETCGTNCVDYVTIPNGNITGTHYAKKEIEIKGFVGKTETVEFDICEQ